MGVNNLPKVATRQCNGWELNSRYPDQESNTLTTTLLSQHMQNRKLANLLAISQENCLKTYWSSTEPNQWTLSFQPASGEANSIKHVTK